MQTRSSARGDSPLTSILSSIFESNGILRNIPPSEIEAFRKKLPFTDSITVEWLSGTFSSYDRDLFGGGITALLQSKKHTLIFGVSKGGRDDRCASV